MRHLHRKHYWLGRLLAADPGYIRLSKAGRTTISLMASVITTQLILSAAGSTLFTPAIVSGLAGMIGVMFVMDDTKEKRQVTTLLLGIFAMIGITVGSLTAGHTYYIDVLMILSVFSSFYFTRFGIRYFTLFTITFLTLNFSSILNLSSSQLPWFYLGIWLGVVFAYVLNFILFQNTSKNLVRSIRSFHIQSNLAFNILIKGLQDNEILPHRKKYLQKTVLKLREYAIIVSGYINENDVQEIWPGLTPAQLRLYVFDTSMLIETLTNSLHSLKRKDALEIDELRRLLLWVTQSLRDAEVLAQNYEEQNLEEAELAVQALRLLIIDLFTRDQQPKGWLYLIRRIESIANHVIDGAITIQHSLHKNKTEDDHLIESKKELDKSSPPNNEKGLRPSTKKAYQALVAGILSIIAGQLISPAQPYWILLTAFIVLIGTESIGRIYTKGYQRSIGTIIGAGIGFAMAKLFSGYPALEILLIFLAVFLAFYFFTVSYTIMSMFITMLIAFLYDILLGGITFSLMGARIIDTIAGAAIAFGVSAFVFPKKTKDKVAESLIEFLNELKPYVTDYVRGFREAVDVKELSERAFQLDQKLQTVKVEAYTLMQRPGSPRHSHIIRWITVFEAINYFAKHLVASSYRKGYNNPEELMEVFEQVEEKLDANIQALIEMVNGTEPHAKIYSLDSERERIERFSPSRNQSSRDLIHPLFYVWRINQAITELCKELGVGKE